MNKVLEFLKQIISVENRVSSKRFLAVFIFTPVLIIALFTGFPIEVLYMISGLIAALLGITSIEKFSKNYNNRNNEAIR